MICIKYDPGDPTRLLNIKFTISETISARFSAFYSYLNFVMYEKEREFFTSVS